jgi:ribosomal protein S18 acetylase RimI-like enzyme
MVDHIKYRKATIADIDFIVDAIITSEQSGTSYTIYERLFEISETEFRKILHQILTEEIPGSEFYCDNFILAIHNERPVASVAAWIEGENNRSSNTIKANILSYLLGKNNMQRANAHLKLIDEVMIDREPRALQIESVYTHPDYRGKRIAADLIRYVIDYYKETDGAVNKIQILSMLGNDSSFKAFTAAGFVNVVTKQSSNPEVHNILPGQGRILWEKIIA